EMMGRLSVAAQAEATPLREILTGRLVLSDDPTHRRVRSLMPLAFTPRRVEMLRPEFEAVADELIDRMQAAGRADPIVDYPDRLTQTELFSNVVGMLNASHETTTNLIGNTVLALQRNPDQWRRLTTEPALMPSAIEEGLRYDSPVQMLMRRASEDILVDTVTVP